MINNLFFGNESISMQLKEVVSVKKPVTYCMLLNSHQLSEAER